MARVTHRRILYVQYTNPAGYPPLEHSSRILADRGWQVLFLGTGAHGADALEFPAHPNITVRRWKFQQPGLWQKLHFLSFNDWVLITALRWKPKWIYASDPFACPVALLLKLIGFRVLYHEHDSPNSEVRGQRSEIRNKASVFQKFLLLTRTWLARRADLCVLPNEKRVEMFREQAKTSRPTVCVWNCPSRDEAIVQPEKSADDLILFYHGSIVPDRLPVSVIYALANLPSSVRLRIAGYETVGHPGYVRELEEFADSRELGLRFEYLGSLSRQALLPETRKAHVGLALMPIKAMDLNLQAMAGASNKPFEYMACGLALLVSDLPDWNEMFVDPPGFARACDPRDPESIASALRWFIENPVKTRNMGERGRKQVLDEWNYETQFEAVSRALESV